MASQFVDALSRQRRDWQDVGAFENRSGGRRLLCSAVTSARRPGVAMIGLREDDNAPPDAKQIEDRQMLQGLRFDAVVGRDRQQSKVDPACAGQHRVHEALVAWHIDEAEDLAVGSRQIRKAEIDRDPPRLFFFQAIAIDAGQGFDQCRLAVVDMASGSDDHLCFIG